MCKVIHIPIGFSDFKESISRHVHVCNTWNPKAHTDITKFESLPTNLTIVHVCIVANSRGRYIVGIQQNYKTQIDK